MSSSTSTWKKAVAGGALVLTGLGVGGLLGSTGIASAAGSATSTAGATVVDESRSQRADEELLTGDVASKVEAAVLAAHPGATVERVETDSDGVYEAHIVTSDGTRESVEVDEGYAVTGVEQGGPGADDDDDQA